MANLNLDESEERALPMAFSSDFAAGDRVGRVQPAHIVLGTAFLLLGLWWFAFEQARNDRQQSLKVAEVENRARVESFQQYVVRTLDVANMVLDRAIAVESNVVAKQYSARVYDRNTLAIPKSFSALTIQSAGSVLASDGKNEVLKLSDDEIAECRRRIQTEDLKACVSTPRPMKDAEVLVGISRPFDGGIATTWLKPREFTNFADRISFGNDDLISLIGLDGVTRARRTGDVFSSGESLAGKLVMQKQFADPDGTYIGPSSIDGIDRIFSHRRLSDYGIFVTSGRSLAGALRASHQRQIVLLIELSLASAAILFFSWFFLQNARRRRAQIAMLAHKNHQLLEAQRIAAIGDWDLDLATGAVHWSAALCDMYQRPRSRAISSLDDAAEYVSQPTAQEIARAIKRVAASGTREEYELEVTLPDGDCRTRHIVAVPTHDESGKIVGIHGTDQDVTEQRRLANLEAQLANRSRLDAMNVLAATLAHELNQPLAAAGNYLAAVRRFIQADTSEVPEECKTAVELAYRQIHEVGDIVRGARDLVSIGQLKLQPVQLTMIVRESLALMSGSDNVSRAEFVLKIEADLAVQASAPQLRQVIYNLLRNASDASHGSHDPRIVITSRMQDAEFVCISVTDFGTGFPAEVPDPFSALSTSKASGLGLGLAISRTIIEAHNGRIWVEPPDGPGSTISFTLRVAGTPGEQLTPGTRASV